MVHHQDFNTVHSAELEGSLPPLPRHCPQGTYVFKGVLFFSKSEAALATLLERYVPGFKTVPGESFQVPLGEGRHVDFRVGDAMVEYHPIRPLHEMRDRREYHRWREELRSLRDIDKENFRRETHDYLAERYENKRRRAVDSSPEFRGSELIVATTPNEFLELVIRRFGEYAGGAARFKKEFSALIEEVKDANRNTKYRHPRRKAA